LMPTIYKRKVIRFGDGGLAMTLPAGWVRFSGIRPGDTLEVLVDGSLVVFPPFLRERGERAEDLRRVARRLVGR
jgi:antitoxin component of MazEF toxin-antitoxin module